MTDILSNYVVTCLTENTRIISDYMFTPPTTCPHDTSHVIDQAQTTIYESQTTTKVSVNIPDGWYQCTTLDLDMPTCTVGTVFTKEISWPMKIYLWTMALYLPMDSEGDTFDVIASPDEPIGYITSTITAGNTNIHVSPTVTTNMIPGLDLAITDGTNYDSLDRITNIDVINGTIDIETTPIHDYAPGSVILFNLKNVRKFEVCRNIATEVQLAQAWVKYKEIPPNTCMRIVYTNTTGAAKCIALKIEYYIMP
jgi:hypothetical protein